MSPARRAPSAAFLTALAILLAAGHALLALTAMQDKSLTADEIGHLTAGLAYNTRSDFRLQPENGNLPQRWAALPATLAGAKLPPTSADEWRKADVWNYGRTFFHRSGISSDWLLFLGRGMIALASAATGLLVFAWSRALFGWAGGFVSLLLYALSPSILAHGALATSDAMMAFFFLAATGAWWRHLERPGATAMAVSAVVFALACVAKFSAVLLIPIFGVCVLATWPDRVRAEGWRPPTLRLLISVAIHATTAWLVIWLFYGFRFSPFAPAAGAGQGYYHGWASLTPDLGWPRYLLLPLRDWHVLPDAFLYGFTFVLQFAQQRAAFFNGEHGIHGWTGFFPYAFLVKNPLPLLALFALGTGAAWTTRGAHSAAASVAARLRPFTPLLALFGVYWLTSLTSHLNIGERHILPTYPVLFILAGGLAAAFVAATFVGRLGLALLAAWYAVESWSIRPHYLAYFNALAGGPANGWRHLVDSSLDWGQDLPALRQWLERQAPREPVYVSYFGTADPTYEGIRATLLPQVPEPRTRRPAHALGPGIYAISATMLQQVYTSPQGPWTAELESEYTRLRELEPLFLAFEHDPARRAELLRDAPASRWTAGWKRYEALRFARLCHYLRARTPDASAGYSILIYRLSREEVAAATHGPLAR